WFSQSTPSGSFIRADGSTSDLGDPDANLGIEGNLKLFYDSKDGLHAWFQYGLFIPLSGLDREVTVEPSVDSLSIDADGVRYNRLDAGLAHTIQVMLGITF
ncbi:MAG: hypothetical protein AAF449_07770, partial [Myxococcota bacterium]